MLPRIVKRAESTPEPGCETCPAGASVAVTLFIPGVCDEVGEDGACLYTAGRNDTRRGGAPGKAYHERFVEIFGREIEAWDSIKGIEEFDKRVCCHKIFYEAVLDACRTARENAEILRARLLQVLESVYAAKPWLTRIHVHVVGFSAGGIMGVNVVSGMPCSLPRASTTPPCAQEMEGAIPIEVDLVTIATPFKRLAFFELPLIRQAFDFLARNIFTPPLIRGGKSNCREGEHNDWPLLHSIFQNDYEDPLPRRPDGSSCMCRFVAFVSSGEHGDESYGADRNPAEDARLEGWEPEVVLLADLWLDKQGNVKQVSHAEVLVELYGWYPGVLDPGCSCTEVF